MHKSCSRRLIASVFLAGTALCSPSVAHAATPAPKFTSPDQNGVNLTTGLVWLGMEEGGIGSGEGRVSMQRIWAEGARWVDNWSGGYYLVTSGGITKAYVRFGGTSDTFTGSGTTWTSDKGDGATLVITASGQPVYTGRDGTQIAFIEPPVVFNGIATLYGTPEACPGDDPGTCHVPVSITRPNGLKFSLDYDVAQYCAVPGEPCDERQYYYRLTEVTSSAGNKLTISYAADVPIGTPPTLDWYKRTGVTFTNTANPPSPVPAISYAYPASNIIDVTDPASRTWRFTSNSNGLLTGIRRPGSSTNNISYSYGPAYTVTSATKDGVTTSYALSGSTMTVTDALSKQTVVTSDLNIGRPTSYKDPLNRTTSYTYDTNGRLKRTTQPELNYTELTYDTRGNVTQAKQVGKNGTSILTSSASYDSTCSNIVKCNRPNSTTDARGNSTGYTYDATHGGLLTVTPPSPATGVQPQTRYSYTQVTSASGALVYMLTGVAACPSGSTSCTSGNEVRTSAGYNSNLLPTSITRGTTSTALRATTAITYDARGNVNTIDGPLAGTADTTKYRYDAADQLVGVTSPDPDGGGALKMRAIRATYRPDGQVSKQELGTVNSQTDADWAVFAALQTVDITFDTNSRPTRQTVKGGTTTYAITQTSYDALGRIDCSAVRMNLAGTIPASACTQSTGSPDRISQAVYDAAGQVTASKIGVGTTEAATERSLTYTNNGRRATLTDGNANTTTYSYDTFDRLYTTTYPGGTFERNVSYDANGNVTSYRNRLAQTTSFAYDALNRLTLKDPAPTAELDVSYGYDNLGRLTSASQTGTSLSFTYDALSRNLTQAGPQGTVTSEWDLAGQRTKITYPGSGLYVNYDHLVTGEVSKIRENGAGTGVGVLASYGYDNLGARTSISYGNGTSQSYTYDPVSRLKSMSLSGLLSGANLVIDNITYNPGSQITSQRRTANYAWSGYSDVTRSHTHNTLNQLTQTSSSGLTSAIDFVYDSKGNLTSDETNGYCYDSENRLTGAGTPSSCTATATLGYDPFGRLKHLTASSVTTSFAYDGLQLIAEYNGSTLLRRHVFGPRFDEPILQYEGSTTGDRRWLYADERGSVMAIADRFAMSVATNSYDEYGIPGSSNAGRFQYTGQVWLPELGLYYYKARFYSPTLGRFLQTDPIGYADNANLYAYVGNDPINFVDPLGLSEVAGENLGTIINCIGWDFCPGTWTVTANRLPGPWMLFWEGIRINPFDFGGGGGGGGRTGESSGGEKRDSRSEGLRNCSAFQKAMQKTADVTENAAKASADMALITGVASFGLGAIGSPAAPLSALASVHFTVQSGAWAAASAGTRVLSGNSASVAVNAVTGHLVKRLTPGMPDAWRDQIEDSLTSDYQGSRCR